MCLCSSTYVFLCEWIYVCVCVCVCVFSSVKKGMVGEGVVVFYGISTFVDY